MEVKLAQTRGFCFGVEDAVELAKQTLEQSESGKLVALGPVIHNKQVVDDLEKAGLNQTGDLETIEEGSTLLIRSHGVSPDVLRRAKERNLNVVDATCVLVKQAQNVVKQLHDEGYKVVMIGDPNHPEVKGVVGYAPDVIVFDKGDDIEQMIPYRERLGIVAQTTHAPEHVAEMIAEIAKRPFRELKIVNTLCLEVTHRQQAAVALCDEVDLMFVLGGLHSANTRELARLCREKNTVTFHLETWDDFEDGMIEGKRVAGVTAGASTPEHVISDFANNLRKK
jgi:(E)-4-hydroxy-3-methyl-but-2-enyl pyrophosphate reductase